MLVDHTRQADCPTEKAGLCTASLSTMIAASTGLFGNSESTVTMPQGNGNGLHSQPANLQSAGASIKYLIHSISYHDIRSATHKPSMWPQRSATTRGVLS